MRKNYLIGILVRFQITFYKNPFHEVLVEIEKCPRNVLSLRPVFCKLVIIY